MSDLTALNEAVDKLVANEASVASELSALRDEVAALSAGTITQEQIDSIAQRVTDVGAKLTEDVNAPDGGVGGTGGEAEQPAEEQPPVPGDTPGDTPVGGEAPAPDGPTPPNDEAPAPDEGPPSA